MAKQNGTSLYENIIVACCLVMVGFLIIALAGDKIAQIFSNDPSTVVSKKSRSNIKKSRQPVMTNTTLEINGEKTSSPLETVIKDKLLNGTYVQTSGGSGGNLTETVDVMNEFIRQLEKLAGGSISDYSNMQKSLKAYERSIQEYISKDKEIISGKNDPLLKTINDLDIKIDLAQDGKLALNLLRDTRKAMANMPDGHTKRMTKLYVKSILNLGKSIDYTVDSRTLNKIHGKIQEIQPFLSHDDDDDDDNDNELSGDISPKELKHKLEILAKTNSLNLSEKQEIAKQLNVYRNGNYIDILPDTYNSDVLCESLAGTVKNNNCIIKNNNKSSISSP